MYVNKNVKLDIWVQYPPPLSEVMPSCKCFPHVSKMPTLTFYHVNTVSTRNFIILYAIDNIFNLRDTEVVIFIEKLDQGHNINL